MTQSLFTIGFACTTFIVLDIICQVETSFLSTIGPEILHNRDTLHSIVNPSFVRSEDLYKDKAGKIIIFLLLLLLGLGLLGPLVKSFRTIIQASLEVKKITAGYYFGDLLYYMRT